MVQVYLQISGDYHVLCDLVYKSTFYWKKRIALAWFNIIQLKKWIDIGTPAPCLPQNYAKKLVIADRASLFLVDTKSRELYARIFDTGRVEEHIPQKEIR